LRYIAVSMNHLLTWVLIAAIGICLYLLMVLLQKKEGFENYSDFSGDIQKIMEQVLNTPETNLKVQPPDQALTPEGEKLLAMLKENTDTTATKTELAKDAPLSGESQKIIDMLQQNNSTNAVTSGGAKTEKGNIPEEAHSTTSSPSPAKIESTKSSPAEEQGKVARSYMSPVGTETKIVVVPLPPEFFKKNSINGASITESACKPKPECPLKPRCVPKPEPKPACKIPKPKPTRKWKPGMPIPTSCPPMPNMKDYVRKDAIPCWACKL